MPCRDSEPLCQSETLTPDVNGDSTAEQLCVIGGHEAGWQHARKEGVREWVEDGAQTGVIAEQRERHDGDESANSSACTLSTIARNAAHKLLAFGSTGVLGAASRQNPRRTASCSSGTEELAPPVRPHIRRKGGHSRQAGDAAQSKQHLMRRPPIPGLPNAPRYQA